MQPLKMFGALLLTLGASAWGLAFFGQCPARLGFALSLMCGGLAWALVPWWRTASPDAEAPSASVPAPAAEPEPIAESVKPSPEVRSKAEHEEHAAHASTVREHALRFCLDVLTPARTNTPLARLHSAYHDWCEARGEEPFASHEIGTELAALFERTDIEVVEIDGTRFIVGAKLKSRKAVLRRMTRLRGGSNERSSSQPHSP